MEPMEMELVLSVFFDYTTSLFDLTTSYSNVLCYFNGWQAWKG